MSRYVLEYAPLYDDPPAMPRSSRLWVPPPGRLIPADGRRSELGGAACTAPHSLAALPLLLPRFGSGAAVDDVTVAALDALGFASTEWVVPVATYVAGFGGGYALTSAFGFHGGGGGIYAGSTGFEVPPVAAHGVLAHIVGAASGSIEQTNTNFYVSPGPHGWDIGLHVSSDRAYPFGGLSAVAGATPGWVVEVGGWTSIFSESFDPGFPTRSLASDYTVFNPGWLPSPAVGGFLGAVFVAGTYPGFAEAIEGSVAATVTLALTYYNTSGTPLGSGPPGYVAPPSSINATDRGGCC